MCTIIRWTVKRPFQSPGMKPKCFYSSPSRPDLYWWSNSGFNVTKTGKKHRFLWLLMKHIQCKNKIIFTTEFCVKTLLYILHQAGGYCTAESVFPVVGWSVSTWANGTTWLGQNFPRSAVTTQVIGCWWKWGGCRLGLNIKRHDGWDRLQHPPLAKKQTKKKTTTPPQRG